MDIFSELTNNQNQNQNQNQNLLKQQMNTQQKINDLLEKSAQTIACGPQCQKNKVSEELKQKYLDIQTTIKNAPSILEQTKKTYYTYTKGKTYYNNMQETELKKNAEIIANELTIQFNKEVEIAHTMNSYLQTALINSGHTSELLSQYRNENYLLENDLSSTYGDILTNDRKTYYESTATERLQLWHRFYKYVYYFLCIVLIIGFVLSKSILNIYTKVVVILLVIFYPYYINFLINKFYLLFGNFYIFLFLILALVYSTKSISTIPRILITLIFIGIYSIFGPGIPTLKRNVYNNL
jgi:hypothetical protein